MHESIACIDTDGRDERSPGQAPCKIWRATVSVLARKGARSAMRKVASIYVPQSVWLSCVFSVRLTQVDLSRPIFVG